MKKIASLPFFMGILLASLAFSAEDFKFDPKSGGAVPVNIGQVLLVKGSAQLIRESTPGPAEKGQKILRADKIQTAKDSMIKIQMVDDTILALGAETQFEFKKFDFKSKEDRQSIYELGFGQLRALFKNKAQDGELSIKTPTVSIGIRGTELLMNSFEGPQKEKVSQVALLKGKVEIEDLLSPGKKELAAGKYWYAVKNNEGKTAKEDEVALDEKKQKELSAPADEEKDFAPFLELLALDSKDSKDQGAGSSSSLEGQAITSGVTPTPDLQKKKIWKDQLKELNKAMKDNRKKQE
ncbi:MAG: FecR family protein [Pseudomonadota bacterium]